MNRRQEQHRLLLMKIQQHKEHVKKPTSQMQVAPFLSRVRRSEPVKLDLLSPVACAKSGESQQVSGLTLPAGSNEGGRRRLRTSKSRWRTRRRWHRNPMTTKFCRGRRGLAMRRPRPTPGRGMAGGPGYPYDRSGRQHRRRPTVREQGPVS